MKVDMGNNMTCPSQRITEVLWASRRKGEDDYDMFFCYAPFIELRITDGSWLILQTETNYIVIGYDGVHIYSELPFAYPEYDIYKADEYVDDEIIIATETLLFKGEELISVERKERNYILQFSDFQMFLCPMEIESLDYYQDSVDYPIHGFERYITRKCTCGGTPELMMDNRGDFVIRCNVCHKCTLPPRFELNKTIDDWNEGGDYEVVDLPIEAFQEYAGKAVKYIALEKGYNKYDEALLDSESLIIAFEDALFMVATQRIGYDEPGFVYSLLTGYNPETWKERIEATEDEPMVFVGEEHEPDHSPVLRFMKGDRPVLATADDGSITIGLSHWGENEEWIEFSNNCLLS